MKHKSELMQTPFRNRAHAAWFRLCAVCLSMYIGYIVYLAHSHIFETPLATAVSLIGYAGVCVGVYGLLDIICRKVPAPEGHAPLERLEWRLFAICFVIALGIFGCTFAACYPGGVNYDVSNQWRQVHSGEYNNWHPLFHTLMMWLLTRFVDSYSFMVLVQIVVFAALLSYLTATVHRCSAPWWLVLIVHALVAASLPVRNTLMFFGKDSAMTMGILGLAIQAVRILHTRGEWLKKPFHAVVMGLTLAYTTLLRVNALFFTVPFVLCVLLVYRSFWKKMLIAIMSMAIALGIVQGPVFDSLDVIYPNNTLEESIGLPMTVLCDIRKDDPMALDTETRLFLNGLVSSKGWQEDYVMHNYNSIKFTFPRELIAERTAGEILGMAARAAGNAPRTAFAAFNGLTDLVWDVTGKGEGYQKISNSGEIESARYPSATLNRLGGSLCRIWETVMEWGFFAWLTENIGVQLVLLLIVTLWALYRRGTEVLLLALPTLLYDLGTMLLLASNDARFFHFSMTITLLCMLVLLFLPCTKEEEIWN